GRFYCIRNGVFGEVGSGCRATTLADVYGDIEGAVAGLLHGFELTVPYRNRQPLTFRDLGGGIGGADFAGALQRMLHKTAELLVVGGNGRRGHSLCRNVSRQV